MNRKLFSAREWQLEISGPRLPRSLRYRILINVPIIMVVLGLPIMLIFALLAVKWSGRSASTDGPGFAPSVPR
jgi:hypothetical protein